LKTTKKNPAPVQEIEKSKPHPPSGVVGKKEPLPVSAKSVPGKPVAKGKTPVPSAPRKKRVDDDADDKEARKGKGGRGAPTSGEHPVEGVDQDEMLDEESKSVVLFEKVEDLEAIEDDQFPPVRSKAKKGKKLDDSDEDEDELGDKDEKDRDGNGEVRSKIGVIGADEKTEELGAEQDFEPFQETEPGAEEAESEEADAEIEEEDEEVDPEGGGAEGYGDEAPPKKKKIKPAAAPASPARPAPPILKIQPGRKLKIVQKSTVSPGKGTKATVFKDRGGLSSPVLTITKKKKFKELGEEQIEHFRQSLLQRRARLVGDLDLMATEALKTTGQDFSTDHLADHGTDNFEQDFTLGLIENEEQVVREIDAALERLDHGRFGECESCRTAIPVTRLEVLPYARMCVQCQQDSEKS